MSKENEQKTVAELAMPSTDLTADISFFQDLGLRLDQIYPSEDPAVARMSGLGLKIRLEKGVDHPAPVLYLLSEEAESSELTAPNGCRIRYAPASFELTQPPTVHKFELRQLRDGAPWVIGRAGMHYRDLIPDRLGGSIIASHIRIPEAGPVPDVVHYHTIGFQLIYCYKGWVRLVYEDQGVPFVLHAGDCVTQPPQIRHRVLEASENLEVVEIGVPADHMTTVDHEMELPTANFRPDREFEGQVFCHHQLAKAKWQPNDSTGFESRDTGVATATKGLADVQVFKAGEGPAEWILQHSADIHFSLVLEGSACLLAEGRTYQIKAGDAFVLPPAERFSLTEANTEFQLLQVSLR